MMRISQYIRKILLLAALLLPFEAQAAEITAIDFSGNVIGQVISTGLVISPDGANIGMITADSMIINQNGNIIGGVVPQGIAIGMDNRLLGKIHSDGIVRSLSGKTVGKVLPNGLVIDDAAQVLGAVLYPGLIYSPKGDAVGRLTGGGEYTKLEGQRIGFVSANGYAYRKTGDDYVLDGRLMSSKLVVSIDGKFLGSIAPTGHIIDFNGKEIGKIHANGYAYNSGGKIIGSVIATGYAFDQVGKYIGIVSYNGEVKRGDQVVAYYRADGNLVRSNGDVVGFAINIAATANDNNGRYLGYIVPGGNIARAGQVVGHIGAKGFVYDAENNKIGEIVKVGPIYDAMAHLKGQSMRNGRIISLGGNDIGYTRGNYAFDMNGTLIGGVSGNMIAIDDKQKVLSVVNVDSTLSSSAQGVRVSPFGYLFNNDNKVVGGGFPISAVYSVNGSLYSHISPNGDLYRQSTGAELTQSGMLIDKKGFVASLVNPLYALNFKSQSLGRFANGNIILDKTGGVVSKVIPGNYTVATRDASSASVSPIDGFSSNKLIALNTGGDLIGYADSNGNVVNLNGNISGQVIYNDYVTDNNRIVNGRLIPFATVVNDKCAIIGVVNGKGDVVNNREVIIGRLLSNGQAISDVGSYIGYAVFDKGLIDYDGNFVGTVSNGIGVDLSGKQLGCVNRNGGIVIGNQSLRYGVVTPSSVIDFDNQIIGHVLANGQVYDNNDKNLGYMQPTGNVVTKSQKTLGNVMRYQVAYSNANRFLGMVNHLGEVVNERGDVVGQVNFDGSVSNKDDNIGYALYDFYVYDENFVTYGYLTKDGTVLSPVGSRLGQLDRGFVIDRNRQVVARGNRDYIVRDRAKDVIGNLNMDGTVTNFDGQNIGYLAEGGSIRNSDGDEIALATPYQYYIYIQQQMPESTGDEPRIRRRNAQIVDATKPRTEPGKSDVKEKKVKRRQFGNRVVGIALSPDGDVIGNIYDDDVVRDTHGDEVGYVRPDGVVVDKNYNEIGVAEMTRKTPGDMFMPPNAFGEGNPYGIGEKPSNVGAGGGYGQGERYDPRRAAYLNKRQNDLRRANSNTLTPLGTTARTANYSPSSFTGYEEDGWPDQGRSISSWRVDMSEMILEDKGIPAVLARSVYASDGFSTNIPVTAIVERNVYAEEGRNVIIPAGSRVIGKISGSGANAADRGAVKIGIAWHRLIRPDGSQFVFAGAQTADAQGRSGAIGYLDQQLLKKYSMPLVTTTLQTAANWLMASGGTTTTTTNANGTTTTQDARSEAMSEGRKEFNERMKEMLNEIIEYKSSIRPVTYVPAGTRIIIYPNQDLWLNSRERTEKGLGGTSSGGERGPGLINDRNLAVQEASGGGGGSGSVTYDGGNQQNIQPATPPPTGSGSLPPPAGNTNQNPAGYTPTPSNQPVPSIDSGDSGDVPELL